MRKIILYAFAVTTIVLLVGCGTTNVNCNYKGMDTSAGKPIAHVNTTVVGYHLCGFYPIFGNGSLTNAFSEFNKEAKRLNGTKVRIVNSTSFHNWMIFPVFTWIITPTISEVAGDIY